MLVAAVKAVSGGAKLGSFHHIAVNLGVCTPDLDWVGLIDSYFGGVGGVDGCWEEEKGRQR